MYKRQVHNNDKSSGHCSVKVDIYFTAIGLIDIPTEDEIKSLMEKIQSNPQEYRLDVYKRQEHTHSYGSDWKNDATNHWHECSCGDKADKAAHDFKWVVDKEATATQKGSKHEECRVCGYKKAAVEIPATGTPTEPGKPTDSDSPQTGDNSNMILWIALLFVSGGVVIGITVYSKKKKENAE